MWLKMVIWQNLFNLCTTREALCYIYFTTIFNVKKNKILYLEDSLAHVCPSLANPLEGLLF